MSEELTPEQQLAVISRAWGKQKGYAFFPWISGDATSKEERIRSYHEGPAYMWPKDKAKILDHLKSHTTDDLYWCPSLFERKRRQMEFAMDEHALWADLDEVDPRTISDYPPTVAWETSPGSYQALWLLTAGDMQGASWRGGENQRLTHHLGADEGGWDTTQLLRVPGTLNHKPERRGGTREGPNPHLAEPPRGRLLWKNGRKYLPDEFEDLPDLPRHDEFEDILEDQIEAVDVKKVWGRVRLQVSRAVRELISATEATGDRSDKLWQMERDLADAGCTAVEVVALVRGTVWNKFSGRADELKRLTIEAGKAIAARSTETERTIEQEREQKPKPVRLADAIRNVKPPRWLVEGLWTEGACGFIAGQPKSFKTWFGLDMALSVSSGTPFLNSFRVVRPGPVLYIQEEDGLPMVAARYGKVWPGKKADRVTVEDGEVVWLPSTDMVDSPVMACVGYGFVVSDPGWQAWLDEVLEEGYLLDDGGREPYRMVVMDPLMMIAGDVEENRAQDMTERLFKPLKQLARKHEVAIPVVHHMRKTNGADKGGQVRGGQLMLGSVANHAWAEDALYVKLSRGGVTIEVESKSAPSSQFDVRNIRNKTWSPHPTALKGALDDEPKKPQDSPRRPRGDAKRPSPALQALKSLGEGEWNVAQIHERCSSTTGRSSVHQQLNRALERGLVRRKGHLWSLST